MVCSPFLFASFFSFSSFSFFILADSKSAVASVLVWSELRPFVVCNTKDFSRRGKCAFFYFCGWTLIRDKNGSVNWWILLFAEKLVFLIWGVAFTSYAVNFFANSSPTLSKSFSDFGFFKFTVNPENKSAEFAISDDSTWICCIFFLVAASTSTSSSLTSGAIFHFFFGQSSTTSKCGISLSVETKEVPQSICSSFDLFRVSIQPLFCHHRSNPSTVQSDANTRHTTIHEKILIDRFFFPFFLQLTCWTVQSKSYPSVE